MYSQPLVSMVADPVDMEGQLSYFSICGVWYPRRVLEPMPHGYRGATALLNCKSRPRFEWIVLCPVRGLSKDRRAYGVGIWWAQDIDLASVIRAE